MARAKGEGRRHQCITHNRQTASGTIKFARARSAASSATGLFRLTQGVMDKIPRRAGTGTVRAPSAGRLVTHMAQRV